MNCARACSLMSEFVDDGLPATLKTEFQQHIAECAECSIALNDMRQMVDGLRQLSAPCKHIDCWPGVRAAILAQEQPRSAWLSWIARPLAWVPVAAVSLILAVTLLVPTGNNQPVKTESRQAVEFKTYMTAHSKLQTQHPLSDPDIAFITAELESAGYADKLTRR